MREQRVTEAIKNRIQDMLPGTTFTPRDFLDVSDNDCTIRRTLDRLCGASDNVMKLMPGIYGIPFHSRFLDHSTPPSLESVAQTIARDRGWTIAPDESTAMNALGLDTQVPGALYYASTGPYTSYDYQGQTVKFLGRKTELAGKSPMTRVIIQALRGLGRSRATDSMIKKMSGYLTLEQCETACLEMSRDRQVPLWMTRAVKRAYAYRANHQGEKKMKGIA